MAWNEAPPTSQELGSSGWDATPPTPQELEGKSVSGFIKNAGTDIGNMAKAGLKASKDFVDPMNMVESAMQGSLQPTKDYLSQNLNALHAMPGAVVKDVKDLVTHPIETAYNHPVNTALNVMGGVDMLGSGLKFLNGAAMAPEAAGIPKMMPDIAPMPKMPENPIPNGFQRAPEGAPNPVDMPTEAAQILKEPIPETPPPAQPGAAPEAAAPAAESVPLGSTFQETVSNLGKQIPNAIKGPLDQARQFAEQKYGNLSKNPGFKDIAGDAMIRRAQGMRFRELGGTPGQARALVRNIGEEGVRELTDIAKEKGITRSPIGFERRRATAALEDSAGSAIGGIRKIAADRGAVHKPNEIVDAIRAKLDHEYLGKGTSSSQKGAYMKALQDIKAHASTPDVLAKKITKMNQFATKNKMNQPTNALTDVANEASRINNDLIKKHLSPEEAEFYKNSLRDFGASKIFQKLQSFEVGRELGGRAGVGGLWRNIKQGAMDMGGSKVMENFYDKFGPRLKSTPGSTNSIGALSEGALEDILSSLDDAIKEVTTGPNQ